MRGMDGTDADSRSKAENEILLGVLDLVERDPAVTQRSVARELGIALGLANAYLKRCIHKGLVKVRQVPTRRYAYYLTPHGFTEKSRLTASYLAYSFSFFRQAQAQFAELYEAAARRGQKRLVLVGEGDLAEIAELVAGKHPIEICGRVAGCGDAAQLAVAIKAIGTLDALVVTAVVEPREVYEAATKAIGADRVYAPPMLRLRAGSKAVEAVR